MPRGPQPLQGLTEAEELESFRKRMGILLKKYRPSALSRLASIAVSTPTQWERGQQEPTLRGAGRLANAVGSCLGWLTGDGPDTPWLNVFPEHTAGKGIVGVAITVNFAEEASEGKPRSVQAWRFSVTGFDRFPPNAILITRPARADDDDGYYVISDEKQASSIISYLMTDPNTGKKVSKTPQPPGSEMKTSTLGRNWRKGAHRVIRVVAVSDV